MHPVTGNEWKKAVLKASTNMKIVRNETLKHCVTYTVQSTEQ